VAVTRLDFPVRPPDNAEHSSPHRLRAASVDMNVDEQRFQDQKRPPIREVSSSTAHSRRARDLNSRS
jgi:hypothetical protein